eukprot:TRINITY_DN18856_c0_g1_i2.p1 TRINITY_DN18856_c0_g1~~TRINITY_DN18856_c0_g1_i2.p1  ORF type:complete len:355 (+),score=107.39 TRINITY_DN18856_c0_g1_i2:71-1066(+)
MQRALRPALRRRCAPAVLLRAAASAPDAAAPEPAAVQRRRIWNYEERQRQRLRRTAEREELANCLDPPPLLQGVRVVLVEPKWSGNVGAAARACEVYECFDMRVVAPRFDPAELHDADARNALTALAAGSLDMLSRVEVCATLAEALAGCRASVAFSRRGGRKRGVAGLPEHLTAAPPAEAGQHPVAFVFGSEDAGLSREAVEQCSYIASLPTGRVQGSLNLAAAVAVALSRLFELRLAQGGRGASALAAPDTPRDTHPATEDDISALVAVLGELLPASTGGAAEAANPADRTLLRAAPRRLRRLLRGAERAEVRLLHGLFRALAARGAGA